MGVNFAIINLLREMIVGIFLVRNLVVWSILLLHMYYLGREVHG